MRKILLCALLLPLTCLYAQQAYMHVKLKGGGTTSFAVQDIRKLTFDTTTTGVYDGKILNIIKTFTLLQNYPNPFNPSTTIGYQLPKTGNVDVNVYDINGRLVRTLLAERQEIGAHSIRWDGRNNDGRMAASGMYFYQVKFDHSVLSKKMLLLK
jgi:hypothetical protein